MFLSESTIVHPGWVEPLLGSDIALLQLAIPSSQVPLQLPEAFTEVSGTDLLVTFALEERDGDEGGMQSLQQEVEHSIVPRDKCMAIWSSEILSSMLCLEGREESEVCGGKLEFVLGEPLPDTGRNEARSGLDKGLMGMFCTLNIEISESIRMYRSIEASKQRLHLHKVLTMGPFDERRWGTVFGV